MPISIGLNSHRELYQETDSSRASGFATLGGSDVDSTDTAAMRQPAGSLGSFRSTFLLWLVWILWLPFFTPPMLDMLGSHPTPLRLTISLVGVVVFFAIYLWVSWQAARSLTSHTLRVFPT